VAIDGYASSRRMSVFHNAATLPNVTARSDGNITVFQLQKPSTGDITKIKLT
jgi:hypothetical protein